MSTKWLKIKAGKLAYRHIRKNGLRLNDIKIWSGAAGGPKWIILSELDKYLSKNYFNQATHKMHFIGGSIGAWRASCYTVDDSYESLKALQYAYINQAYDSDVPTPSEVSSKIKEILSQSLGEKGIHRLLNPKNKFVHIMTSAMDFETSGDSNLLIKMKFGWLAANYILSRKSLNRFATRNIFSNYPQTIIKSDGMRTRYNALSQNNLAKTLAATGSIPMMMNGIVINDQEHRDGGLIDYHLDLKYQLDAGIVFYPHFYPFIKPGWFDKYNGFRKSKYHDRTLLLYPSEDLINLLPDKQLSQLKDFYTYAKDPQTRIKRWNIIADLGKHLIADFITINENETALQENLTLW